MQPGSAHFAPWVLAEIARVSLVHGTEFNRKVATDDDLLACSAAYQALREPALSRQEPGGLGNFFLRIGAEQLSFQQPVLNDLARTAALLEQTASSKEMEVATHGWADRLLGGTLAEYVGAAILLHAGALNNQGTFDLGWLSQPNFEEVTRGFPEGRLQAVIQNQYVATREELKATQLEAYGRTGVPKPDYRRFSFNPLASRPVVSGISDDLIIPVPGLIVRQASPLGIFYTGVRHWGSSFARDLGALFESYVGRQLTLIPDAEILPEIAYGRNKGFLSVDWFAVFDDIVLLVEVKSARPTESIRVANAKAGEDLLRILGHAVEQLNVSASTIRTGEPGFEQIPSDRPLVGLIVTMEPFHNVNATFGPVTLPNCDIPFAVCSAIELEALVTLLDVSIGRLVHGHLTDPGKRGWSIKGALVGHEHGRNAVLDAGWASYPWTGLTHPADSR